MTNRLNKALLKPIFAATALLVLIFVVTKRIQTRTDSENTAEKKITHTQVPAQTPLNKQIPLAQPQDKPLPQTNQDAGATVEAILAIYDSDERNAKLYHFLKLSTQKDLHAIKSVFEEKYSDSLYMREWETFLVWWGNFAAQDSLRYASSDFNGEEWLAKHLASAVAAENWLERDPQAASTFLENLPANEVRENTTIALGQAYAIADLDAALNWADNAHSSDFKQAALLSVTIGSLRNNMHNFYDLENLEKTASWLRSHSDQDYSAPALSKWVGNVVRADWEEAAGWVNWVIELPEGNARNAALESFFSNAAHTPPEILDGWFDKVENGPALDYATTGYIISKRHEYLDAEYIEYLSLLAESIDHDELREKAFNSLSGLEPSGSL